MNPFIWLELPVIDMDRAMNFYENVLEIELKFVPFGEFQMAWFPNYPDQPGITGALVKHSDYEPSSQSGPVVYLQTTDIEKLLERVEAHGGQVVQTKKEIGDGHGFMGLFIDSEGNRVATHSNQ